MIRPAFLHSSTGQQQQMMQPAVGMPQQQEPMAYGQAITQGPGGQMYTDRSMQTPYNPQQQMPKMQQDIAHPPMNIVNGSDLMRRSRAEVQPIQDMRARPPQDWQRGPIRPGGNQGGIGSFPNPFGGFMGGGRGQFMQPQPPMYGGGFGGYGMQPPMYGGGMGYGMPPMFGGGMYGGGFGMQPPMFGGGYGGGFGSPFGQSFYGGIGGMFPGMGGGYGMQRPPSYGGFGGGNYNFGPQPALPIRPQPMPRPVRPSLDSLRPTVPQPIQMLEQETKGPESFENNLIRKGRDGMMIY